jgi:hypothetical protein
MKFIFGIIAAFHIISGFSQPVTSSPPAIPVKSDPSTAKAIFFEDFTNNKNNWPVVNNKYEISLMDAGVYYLTAVGHAYGEGQEVKIDSRKDFEIETRIKILAGHSDHKNYYNDFLGKRRNERLLFYIR